MLELLKQDLKPRDIMTYKAFENALVLVMATGGSTNAVLHFIAMARCTHLRKHARTAVPDCPLVLAVVLSGDGLTITALMHQLAGLSAAGRGSSQVLDKLIE